MIACGIASIFSDDTLQTMMAESTLNQDAKELAALAQIRDRQFTGLTLAYLVAGLLCLFLKNDSPAETPQAFLTHGTVICGLSLLYVITIALVLRFHNELASSYVNRIPPTAASILERAQSLGLDYDRATRQTALIRKSTGYAKLLGLKTPAYCEIRFLRDLTRVGSVFIFILAANIGWSKTGDLTLPALSFCAAAFLWISSTRYEAPLNFLQTLISNRHDSA